MFQIVIELLLKFTNVKNKTFIKINFYFFSIDFYFNYPIANSNEIITNNKIELNNLLIASVAVGAMTLLIII
jgi:hypothetical protein